ncbi:endonuclease/exonuclease/phosphatase family protein [Roseovarius sp. D22-M7]|uniref:endonuclease/exonuclease/phosphatase family protein n=1 Tax=Roseovarius sp. D22-M7 TaxID=3127116 RepID=UPI00301015A4
MRWLIAFCIALMAGPVLADGLRIATWNVGLDRTGPGILLRDILRDEDPQIAAISRVLARTDPDIVVLQKVDYDLDLHALRALRDRLAEGGPRYDHIFARRPNSGMPTGLDMDGDGRRGNERDAQGYGAFSGQAGMAILSRYPIEAEAVQDFSTLLWRDLPGALLPTHEGGTPFPSAEAQDIQRLSYTGHWVVPILLPSGPLHLMAFHAGPPVFDGPEDANGRRNHDEIRFWQLYLDGAFGPAPDTRFVVMGDANLDPARGDGRRAAIRALLTDPRLQDPRPAHDGPPPRHATVHWDQTGPRRVSYILPSADLRVVASGIHWPPEGTPAGDLAATASHHRLIWVELALP